MANPSLSAVILAAAEGTRMRSARPKPLHLLCGRAMLCHVLDAVAPLGPERAVVVVGHGAERVTKKLIDDGPAGLAIEFVEQRTQRGTGEAALVALTAFPDDDLDPGSRGDSDVLVVPGDTPLLRSATLARLVDAHRQSDSAMTLLTAHLDDPTGYGRVVRTGDGRVARVVEQADVDADPVADLDAIDEVATSVYCFKRSVLAPALRRLRPENAQGEYHLTDVVEVLANAGYLVSSVVAADPVETTGVNDRAQLAHAEAELRRRTNAAWMTAGVTMIDPERCYVDASVHLAADVTLFPGCVLTGHTSVGEGTEIGPGCQLADTAVGANCRLVQTVAVAAEIGDDAQLGPFAHLRPGTIVPAGTITGPFYAPVDGADNQEAPPAL